MSASFVAPRSGPQLRALPGALPLGGIFGGLAVLACAATLLLGLDRLGFTTCFFKLTTGLPCPTCGSTRALGRLAHLDLAGAFSMNPLATVGAVGLVLWALGDLVLLRQGRALRLCLPVPWRTPVRLLAGLALLLNWAFLLAAAR